jgi:hypothetical protein
MPSLHLPFQLVLLMFAGWVNRHQLDVIEYLQEENRVVKARLGGKQLRFTDAERGRLTRKAHALGRKLLSELDTLVTPNTLSRWYRHLIARQWTNSRRPGPGRARVMTTIADAGDMPGVSRAMWTAPREAERTRQAFGIRTP